VALACASPLVAAPTAEATARDSAADHVAISAWVHYVSAGLAALPVARTNAETFKDSIATSCMDVLAPLNLLPAASVNEGTLTALGEEIGFDVALTTEASLRAPFNSFAATLERLHWSTAMRARIKRDVQAERRWLSLAPSALCSDAQAVASTNAQNTPAATLHFIANTTARANARGSRDLLAGLAAVARRSDGRRLVSTRKPISRLAAADKALIDSVGAGVLEALGITASASAGAPTP
jgi:hypothetical protein